MREPVCIQFNITELYRKYLNINYRQYLLKALLLLTTFIFINELRDISLVCLGLSYYIMLLAVSTISFTIL